MDMALVDEVVKVADDEAVGEVRLLAAREGILAGSCSCAALTAVRKIAAKIGVGNIVVILPD